MCILGLCCLMDTQNDRDKIITDTARQIIPSALLVFRGLKNAYQAKTDQTTAMDSTEDSSDEAFDTGELDDEDEFADENDDEPADENEDEGADEKDSEFEIEDDRMSDIDSNFTDGETPFHAYRTVLESAACDVDEYMVFKDILSKLHSTNSGWYSSLTEHLDETQQKEVQDVLIVAEQRKVLAELKKIESQ